MWGHIDSPFNLQPNDTLPWQHFGRFFFLFFCFILFCFCFVLFCFVLLCFVLFRFVLLCFVLFWLFCFVLFCFVLFWFCFVLFCFIFSKVLQKNVFSPKNCHNLSNSHRLTPLFDLLTKWHPSSEKKKSFIERPIVSSCCLSIPVTSKVGCPQDIIICGDES